MKKTAYKILTSIALASVLGFSFLGTTKAQEEVPLTVAPARQYLSVDPGGKLNGEVKFFNHSAFPVSGQIKIVDFIVQDDSGAPVLLEGNENLSSRFSAASWAQTPLTNVTIAKESLLKIPFSVNVPANARPGGRYIAVIFEASGSSPSPLNTTTEGVSSVAPRVVGLVSIRINGPISEGAYVDTFKVPMFVQFGPVPIHFEVFNNGDYHITPKGKLTLTNWFNKKTDTYDLEEKNIFPDARRTYDVELGKTWMFGRYKVDLVATYGESGQVLKNSSYVWVVPIVFIMAIILAIAIVVLGSLLLAKKLKAKQTRLEEKLEKEISEVELLKSKFKDQMPKARK